MKRILLLYPPFEGKNYLTSRAPFPIGPLYLAAYLKKKRKKSAVVDMSYPPQKIKVKRPKELKTGQPNYFRFGWSDTQITDWLKERLDDFHEIVGVSSLMSSNWTGAYNLINLIKRVDPKREVIIGGPHATAFPDHVHKNSQADYICIGEGEEAFYKLLKGEKHEGIIKSGQTLDCRRSFISQMDSLPFPSRKLLWDNREMKEIYITFSRGCPHRCSFCGSHLIQGRIWRHKSPKRMIEEVQHYHRNWGIRKFVIEDDNPCAGKKGIEHLKEFCRQVIAELPKLRFTVSHGIPVYATADKELSELLYKAGFRNMVFPLESTNPQVLEDMQKEFTPKNWRKAIKNWKYEKAHPTEIILGYPFVETIESMLMTMIEIAKKKGRVWASHFRLNKGTPLFERCLEAGYVNASYDPINTQAFFIETERFNLNDLKELMQISRGINFATELGFNPFKDIVDATAFHDFKYPDKIGDTIAKGNFSFRRSQNITASIMLTVTGKHNGRPYVTYGNSQSLVYKGDRPSRVYDVLKYIITGQRRTTIRSFLK